MTSSSNNFREFQVTTLRPFRGRRVNRNKPVWVYKNLHRPGWYSVRQGGKVVAHATSILLFNATFVVQTAGRRRAKRDKVKNVHAFAVGKISATRRLWFQDGDVRLGHRAGYRLSGPRTFYVDYGTPPLTLGHGRETIRLPMFASSSALLNDAGLSVDGPRTFP